LSSALLVVAWEVLEVALEGAGVFDLESLLFVLAADEICEISGSCDAILTAVSCIGDV
jgi:hypothetical protein